jgi:hypothetical protein
MRTRTTRPLLVLLAVLAAVLLVAGCAKDAGDGSAKPSGKSVPTGNREGIVGNDAGPSAGQAEGELQVRLTHVENTTNVGGSKLAKDVVCTMSIPAQCSRTVTCPASAGDSDGAELCRWLAAFGLSYLTQKPPKHEACTMIYGGPEEATIMGTVDGKQVDRTFTRQNGCEIARFDEVSPLWTGNVPASDAGDDPSAAGGGAAGSCLAQGEPGAGDDPRANASSGGSNADDTSCATPEPQVIDDPPEAFR